MNVNHRARVMPSSFRFVPYWLSLVLLGMVLAGFGARPAAATLLISVDKTTQRMAVSLNGRPLWMWPVSTGRSGYDTPSGKFTPFRLEREHFSREWDEAPMPHSIFFTREGHAIHGTTEQSKLGRRASHGCIRLSRPHAARLFDLVSKHGLANTRVVVFSEKPRAPAPMLPPVAATQPPLPSAPPVYGMETDAQQPADFSPHPTAFPLAPFAMPTSGQ
jgi:hypothetical protein